jgi:hypothetical protein
MAAAGPVLASANAFTTVAYYLIGGFGWVVPGMLLISWMSRS